MKNTGSNRQIRGVVSAIMGGVSAAAMCTPLFAQTAPAAANTSDDQLQEVTVTSRAPRVTFESQVLNGQQYS